MRSKLFAAAFVAFCLSVPAVGYAQENTAAPAIVQAAPPAATIAPAPQVVAPAEPVKVEQTETEKAGVAVGSHLTNLKKRIDDANSDIDALGSRIDRNRWEFDNLVKSLEEFQRKQGTADDFLRGLNSTVEKQSELLGEQEKKIAEAKAVAERAAAELERFKQEQAAKETARETPVVPPAAAPATTEPQLEFPRSGQWKDYKLDHRMYVARREFIVTCGYVPENFSGPKVEDHLMKIRFQDTLMNEISETCQKLKDKGRVGADDDKNKRRTPGTGSEVSGRVQTAENECRLPKQWEGDLIGCI